MAILDIVKYPDPRLREPTVEVPEITDEVRTLVRDLKDTMFAADGAGIAAIQVGRFERIFLIDGRVATGSEEADPMVFINPEVVETSD
ncbi:MAG: peptide deformylase, partial [Nannocystaceae bacterium]